jgi:hypothetical protein
VAGRPLRPTTDRCLGRPLPHQLANLISAAPVARGSCESPAFTLRSHAVLIRLSPGYPPLLGTFRYITHPFATRHQDCSRAAVRLACVRHAASVQSEPGSNSSVQSLFKTHSLNGIDQIFTTSEFRLYLSMSVWHIGLATFEARLFKPLPHAAPKHPRLSAVNF